MNETNAAAPAVKTLSFIARCKCPGKMGALRFEALDPWHVLGARSNPETRDAANYLLHVMMGTVPGAARPTRCWTCKATIKVDSIRGEHSPHACGAKCMSSKGPSCECACGGANHGKGWA